MRRRGGFDVDGPEAVERGFVGVGDGEGGVDAGGVDEGVEAAEAGEGGGGPGFGGGEAFGFVGVEEEVGGAAGGAVLAPGSRRPAETR